MQIMTLDEYVGQAAGVTQADMAVRLGISRPYLNQLLNRTREPGAAMMRKIYEKTGGKVTMDSWTLRPMAVVTHEPDT